VRVDVCSCSCWLKLFPVRFRNRTQRMCHRQSFVGGFPLLTFTAEGVDRASDDTEHLVA
jgi:hypothetical protein